jgi:glutamine amidotransferase
VSTIAILDYGVGNLRSVANAVSAAGATAVVTSDPAVAEAAEGLIIPGVGAFPHVMSRLTASGLDQVVRRRAAAGAPMLGICVGMQLLFETGLEFEPTPGLGLIPGQVRRIVDDSSAIRLPHIAWTEIAPDPAVAAKMFDGLAAEARRFYFLHSFGAADVPDAFVAARASYENVAIVAAVRRGALWGTQFHPEKSGPAGQRFLRNFIASCGPAS